MERKTIEQALNQSKSINNPSNQNFRIRQFLDEEQFLNYILNDNLEPIYDVLEIQQYKLSHLQSLAYTQQNHQKYESSIKIEPEQMIKQFQNICTDINDPQTEHTKDTHQNSKVKQIKNEVEFVKKNDSCQKKIKKNQNKNHSNQQNEQYQMKVVETLPSKKKLRNIQKEEKAEIHKPNYKKKQIYKKIVQKVKIQEVKRQQNVQRTRKIRTNLTEQMINILKNQFQLANRNKNNEGGKISLKEIANSINLGYSTTLHKYREYRESGQIQKAPRKYNKSLMIEEYIKKVMDMRKGFRTYQQLSDIILGEFGLKISRSIVGRHYNIILEEKQERKRKEKEQYKIKYKRQEEMRQKQMRQEDMRQQEMIQEVMRQELMSQ